MIVLNRITFSLLAVALLASCNNQPEPEQKPQAPNPQFALRAAAIFLVNQQSKEDGNWYAETYGPFKQVNQSPAPTALVVYALAHLPDDLRKAHEPTIRKVLDRLREQITEKGFVGDIHGAAHYPTYVTGMVLATYHRLGWQLPQEDQLAMIRYIESAQLGQSRGWTLDDGHFGGWDLIGDQMVQRQAHGPGTNVSVTSFAIEGLSTAMSDVDGATRLFAERWLDGLQNASSQGGFAFGPDQFATKAGHAKTNTGEKPKQGGAGIVKAPPPTLHSYGSATCDGLRSLAYLQIPADDKRVEAAQQWIISNDLIDEVPGFNKANDSNWQQSLYYYYTMSLAKVYRLYPKTGTVTRRSRLADRIAQLQQPDGSWVNAAQGMREDDPLIATSFALIAIAQATAEQ